MSVDIVEASTRLLFPCYMRKFVTNLNFCICRGSNGASAKSLVRFRVVTIIFGGRVGRESGRERLYCWREMVVHLPAIPMVFYN